MTKLESLNLKQNLLDIEEMLRQNSHMQAKALIGRVNFTHLDRRQRLELAQLANRSKAPLLSLKILKPIVRPEKIREPGPNNQEIAEYALSLNKIGAYRESERLLSTVENQADLEIMKLKSYAYIYQWNYAEAISVLKQYLRLLEPESYAYLIGLVNLASAYITELNYEKAQEVIETIGLKMEVHGAQNPVLLVNFLELQAQNLFYQKQYSQAIEKLKEARQSIDDKKSIYSFFVEKWMGLCKLYQNPQDPKNLERIKSLIERALKWRHWESLRELDLHRGLATRNKYYIARAYFGTANENYLRRIDRLIPSSLSHSEQFIWTDNESKPVRTIGLGKGDWSEVLKNQRILLRLLQILGSDLYRPFHLGEVFYLLYPDEQFDPDHSPTRIHQIVARLRKVLLKMQLGIHIQTLESSYKLEIDQGWGILKKSKQKLISNSRYDESLQSILNNLNKTSSFTATDAMRVLDCPRGKAIRVINHGIALGLLQKVALGKKTYYLKAQMMVA